MTLEAIYYVSQVVCSPRTAGVLAGPCQRVKPCMFEINTEPARTPAVPGMHLTL